ncbi:universal stress protein [Actinoplanes palleronii]|uniref:Universal stress protein n=2 Tax=Actinoplanes palleronii TaxID=113570 RepID=A0ABQ4BD96_9ACTN|nr:universal stress protein [Actinoplanes palleronii]
MPVPAHTVRGGETTMNDLDRLRVEHEARQRAGAPHRATPYSEVVNRYLNAFSYVDPYVPAPAPPPDPAAKPHPAGRVIVGADELPTAHLAVDLAAIEAGLRGTPLRIVHAGSSPRTRPALDRLAERVRRFAPEVAVSTRVTAGMGPAEMLLAEATADDLIVVGHRHGAARGSLRRSVADQVAARHTGPVLVVRAPGWPTGPESPARPLVVGVNGTAAATRAAEFAVEEARVRGCDVVLLHAVGEPSEVPDWTDRRGGVSVRNHTVVGDPVTELVAASEHAAAIVVGRDAGRQRLGSVNRAVLHRAHCPIFLVG